MKNDLACYLKLFASPLLLLSIQLAFGMEKELIHFANAKKEFESDKDKEKFDLYKSAIKEYYNSGKYDEEVKEICEKAQSYFSKLDITEESLVIFDVDDTAIRFMGCWQAETLNINIPENKIILPVLGLYEFLISKGFKVIFLTGRMNAYYDLTKKELEEAGYIGFTHLICMPDEFCVYNAHKAVGTWKFTVRQKLAQIYKIEGCIADRDLDFYRGYTGKGIKLPNYVY